ncbi:MAG: hypothetical protein HWN70_13460 [Desulfobacterales bacterium]|nr:hypothetical protein [Desulfobacterales bacterium]
MNSGKVDILGTFEERYLEIVNSRVRGAVLLEKRRSISIYGVHTLPQCKGSPPVEYEAIYLITIYLIIWNGKAYCGECGSQLTVARENEHYTIPAEICCKSCGLVYELDDIY